MYISDGTKFLCRCLGLDLGHVPYIQGSGKGTVDLLVAVRLMKDKEIGSCPQCPYQTH